MRCERCPQPLLPCGSGSIYGFRVECVRCVCALGTKGVDAPQEVVDNSTKIEVGSRVRLQDEVAPAYRKTFGSLVDDLTVEKIVDDDRVILRWLGIVPTSHLKIRE